VVRLVLLQYLNTGQYVDIQHIIIMRKERTKKKKYEMKKLGHINKDKTSRNQEKEFYKKMFCKKNDKEKSTEQLFNYQINKKKKKRKKKRK